MTSSYSPGVPAVLRELSALRQRHEAERLSLVAQAVDVGASSQDIADALAVSRSTLWRRYGTVLRRDIQRQA